ncbi:MAG: hypothetical protein WCH43_12905, partial [Verrucomicrobiota bacterium]
QSTLGSSTSHIALCWINNIVNARIDEGSKRRQNNNKKNCSMDAKVTAQPLTSFSESCPPRKEWSM